MIRVRAEKGEVFLEEQASHAGNWYQCGHPMTPLEAEKILKELRAAIDKARAQTAKKRKLGEY